MSITPPPTAPSLLKSSSYAVFCFTMIPLMLWSSVAITKLALSLNVHPSIAWIPAVATDGAMLIATAWAVNDRLDKAIRLWAGWVAVAGIVGSVLVAGAEHYVVAIGVTPPPEMAIVIGGIPSLMGALLVHVLVMIRAQQRRLQEDLDETHADLTTAQGLRQAARREVDEATRIRQEGYQKERSDLAAHRKQLCDDEVADTRRRVEAVQQAEVEAATRSQRGLRQELQQAAALQQELDEARAAAEATKTATERDLAEAEANRERAAQLLSDAETDREVADEERREAERLRSKARRRRESATTPASSQPVSQPPVRRDATVSQPSSQPVSRSDRVKWAVGELRSGRDLRPCDVDKEFGPPRNGVAVLKSARERFEAEVDGEWRAISTGAGGGQ